ncbi:hypothetical protein M9458_037737, partial [Cirrhinus mrigala]
WKDGVLEVSASMQTLCLRHHARSCGGIRMPILQTPEYVQSFTHSLLQGAAHGFRLDTEGHKTYCVLGETQQGNDVCSGAEFPAHSET